MNTKELTVVDIGTFCLISKRYGEKLLDAGIENVTDAEGFLKECSESVSEHLRIMDNCQKLLWKYGADVGNAEKLSETKAIFEQGLEIMQSVLKAFDIAVCENQK